jgi:hypothetical protein
MLYLYYLNHFFITQILPKSGKTQITFDFTFYNKKIKFDAIIIADNKHTQFRLSISYLSKEKNRKK